MRAFIASKLAEKKIKATRNEESNEKSEEIEMKTLTFSLFIAAVLTVPVLAQDEAGRFEFGVSAIGGFQPGSTGNGVSQSGTKSGGVLATSRFFFTPSQGAEVDYGYTRDTQQYNAPSGLAGVQTDMHEFSASYVYRFTLGRIKPFATAGVGGVVFDPVLGSGALVSPPDTQARAAFVYSVGADLKITSHLSFRAQYRGLVYKAPDFASGIGSESVLNFSEPAGGLVWRF
jgi:opacity protein-like surface antigen